MIKQLGTAATVTLILGFSMQSNAATISQVKGRSAIIELTDFEIQSLAPSPGQSIQISFDGKQVDATVTKLSKKKILVNTSGNLSGQKIVEITAGGSGVSGSNSKTKKSRGKPASASSPTRTKNWMIGAGAKYALGGQAKFTINTSVFNIAYSGFVLSGVGLYYWGNIGVGAEGEFGSFKGTESSTSHSITQMQVSAIGEYRFGNFSAGGIFTLASNYKSSDSVGNESSLNGMGFGIYGTYAIIPEVRLTLDYKTMNYKLDPASVTSSDIRIGAGYYF